MFNDKTRNVEFSRVAAAGIWGDKIRLGVVGSWTTYLLLSDPGNTERWAPLVVYSALAMLILGLRRFMSNLTLSALVSLVVDVSFLSYLVHFYGSHTSQVAVYYLLVVLGYHLIEPRPIRRSSLTLSIVGYATILILERYEIIVYFDNGHLPGILPPIDQTISSFLKIAVALIGTYGVLSISAKKIDKYIKNERRLLDEKRHAQEQSKVLQKQIEASQRLESLGRLAGGVAHDFNNLLTGILSYTQFLKDSIPSDNESQRDVDAIISATEKASKLTAQLLTFGRKQIIRLHIVNLNKIVSDTQEILRRSISENIKIETNLTMDLGNIKADSSQIEQVLLNLVVNARDAMPMGGTLTISTENLEITSDNFKHFPELSLGPHVKVCVSDTGQGISPEHIDKIFDPFFTTKKKEKGTGLGLSTVYGIVSQNSAHIDVKSEFEKGTTFCIVFPRVFETVSQPTSPQPIVPGCEETILLAEDEEMVRASITRILKKQNYDVIAAASGEEAMELFLNRRCNISLLLTDVIMTGITGETLAQNIKEHRPDIPVLFMSGYTEDAIVDKGILNEDTAFLAKPFNADELLVSVAKTLKRSKRLK